MSGKFQDGDDMAGQYGVPVGVTLSGGTRPPMKRRYDSRVLASGIVIKPNLRFPSPKTAESPMQ